MSDLVQIIAIVTGFLALMGVTNVLCWMGVHRSIPGRPWHWTAVVGSFAYYPWLNRQERLAKDAESAARCAKAENLLADVNERAGKITSDLAARRRAIEQIVTASFTAGYGRQRHHDRADHLLGSRQATHHRLPEGIMKRARCMHCGKPIESYNDYRGEEVWTHEDQVVGRWCWLKVATPEETVDE